MVGNAYGPPDPVQDVMRREAKQWWWLPLVTGVAWFVIGWAVLRADVTALKTVGVLLGVVFLGVALTEMVLAWLFHGGWRFLHAVLAVIYLLGSLWSFVRPVDTFFALASVLGLILLLQGIATIAQSIALKDVSPYWGLSLFSGILITGLGLWVSTSDQVWTLAARSAFILLWVGFMAIFRGIQDVATGFTMLHYSKENDESPRQSGQNGAAAVPSQRESASRSQVRPAG